MPARSGCAVIGCGGTLSTSSVFCGRHDGEWTKSPEFRRWQTCQATAIADFATRVELEAKADIRETKQ